MTVVSEIEESMGSQQFFNILDILLFRMTAALAALKGIRIMTSQTTAEVGLAKQAWVCVFKYSG